MPSAADPHRRRLLLRRFAGAALLGGTGLADLIGQALAAGTPIATQGIRRLGGQVMVNGAAAREGQIIQPGDTVVTAAASEAVYVIGHDAFMQRAQTSVSFGAGAAVGVLRVISGRLLSVFGSDKTKSRSITTPTATIGIRGTGCYIEAEAERVYFCLCYGEADLVPTAATGERELIRTTHHDHPLYIHNDMAMPKMMVPAGVINHSDAELTLLESLVGRLPPFAVGQAY